ncbi:hypothetical protein F5Y14DRAFT_412925 [Nemania sp. NC0429]|nr:hypothetical protein F5Y14DRAFT_412925 [Nemania sp. NC0429]
MERTIPRKTREEQELFEFFFVHGDKPGPHDTSVFVEVSVKGHISKNLDIPWHQTGPGHARE